MDKSIVMGGQNRESSLNVTSALALASRSMLVCALLVLSRCSYAQAVSPVIAEFRKIAEGRIALTNNTFTPMAVVLEARSFSIDPDGVGVYRPLDPSIHIRLSSMSARLDPGHTYYVSYRAEAEALPAWFTIYSTFSILRRGASPDVRILLPHTVYIYPTKPKSKSGAAEVEQWTYLEGSGKLVVEMLNDTLDLERVEEIRIDSDSHSNVSAGFPMLPGSKRRVEVDWEEKEPPERLLLRTNRSNIRLSLHSLRRPD